MLLRYLSWIKLNLLSNSKSVKLYLNETIYSTIEKKV